MSQLSVRTVVAQRINDTAPNAASSWTISGLEDISIPEMIQLRDILNHKIFSQSAQLSVLMNQIYPPPAGLAYKKDLFTI